MNCEQAGPQAINRWHLAVYICPTHIGQPTAKNSSLITILSDAASRGPAEPPPPNRSHESVGGARQDRGELRKGPESIVMGKEYCA